jgi:hypothetical protein
MIYLIITFLILYSLYEYNKFKQIKSLYLLFLSLLLIIYLYIINFNNHENFENLNNNNDNNNNNNDNINNINNDIIYGILATNDLIKKENVNDETVKNLNSKFIKIQVDGKIAVGLKEGNELYITEDILTENIVWKYIPGVFKDFSFSKNNICVLNNNNIILCSSNLKDISFKELPGTFKKLALDNRVLIALNENNEIFYREDYDISEWKKTTGILNSVSIENNILCGLKNNEIWYCSNYKEPNWKRLSGKFIHVEIKNNKFIVINEDNDSFYSIYDSETNNINFINLNLKLKYITISRKNINNLLSFKDRGFVCNINVGTMPLNIKNNSVSCASYDGVNCLVNKDITECNTLLNKIPDNELINVSCGSNNNYNSSHFCSKAYTEYKINKDEITEQDYIQTINERLNVLNNRVITNNTNINNAKGIGKLEVIKNRTQLNDLMRGGIFRLRVNIPILDPYIKGVKYTTQNPNFFYLGIEKLEPNCEINENIEDNICKKVFIDNKDCRNKLLAEKIENNFRFVLIPSIIATDESMIHGKNIDFTIVEQNGKTYLKNIQTGLIPKLYSNNTAKTLHGMMINNHLSNLNSLNNEYYNACNNNIIIKDKDNVKINTSELSNPSNSSNNTNDNLLFATESKTESENKIEKEDKYITCDVKLDDKIYLMTSKNVNESSSIEIDVNRNGTINIILNRYNVYGVADKKYNVIFEEGEITTMRNIEKIVNKLGVFLVNMVGFEDINNNNKDNKNKNRMNLMVEMIKYSDDYKKKYSINKL